MLKRNGYLEFKYFKEMYQVSYVVVFQLQIQLLVRVKG